MITDIWSNSYVKELSDDQITSFHEIVMRDVKNKSASSEEKTILVNNPDLWLYCLQITRKEIELQLSQHKINLKAKINELEFSGNNEIKESELRVAEGKWRNNAMKFLNSVEKKMLYVKMILQEESDEDLD